MPPKPDENLKNRKKTDDQEKKDEEEPEKGKDTWEKIKKKLTNPAYQKYFYWTAFILFIIALVIIILYIQKLRTVTEKYRAATKIHVFMQRFNDSFRGKKPIQTFKGTEEVMAHLRKLYARNNELQRSIEAVIRLIKDDWVPYGGHLHKFYNKIRTFYLARKFCEDNNTALPEVHSDADQEFIVEEIFKNEFACWLGIMKIQHKWAWLSGGTPKKFYWVGDRQAHSHWAGPVCVDVHVCPKNQRPKCWNDIPCTVERRFICRMNPDSRWL